MNYLIFLLGIIVGIHLQMGIKISLGQCMEVEGKGVRLQNKVDFLGLKIRDTLTLIQI
jgi:hypothetical protein